MYDIRQFKPALYALLLLGITGFALASQSAGLWIFSVAAVGLNAWLVKTGRFRPLPHFVSNVVTIGGLSLLIVVVRRGGVTPILLVGQFLVLLQVVKLYEQRANRDFAQLLVLSLLLMVAAAISTASLVFGLMFIAYLFLSLYCCLLFHLKVETDQAKVAIGIPSSGHYHGTLRQDQRYFSQSMRRLTGLVSAVALASAVLTFLFFPRGTGAGLLEPFQWKPSQTLTGFTDSVSFQNVAKISQNTQIVAYVKVSKQGQSLLAKPLLLRGVALDRYSGRGDEFGANPYQWKRTVSDSLTEEFRSDESHSLGSGDLDEWINQQITLEPTGTNVLFAIGGISSFKPSQSGRYRYSREDEVLESADPITQTMRYEVVSRDRLTADPARRPAVVLESDVLPHSPDGSRAPRIDPKIEAFARRPEVSGSDGRGRLVDRRPFERAVSPLDGDIAHNIESYLRSNFTYTLDLTDARRIAGQDPMVAFLYDLKRGHCEYFAGAMTLMCQSLGMQARMVVGFKCDEYNSLGGMYVVRQSHAHAWVEVLTADGSWATFDPTSGREADAARHDSLWQRTRGLFNYLEYIWANSVVAYNRDSRKNVIENVNQNFVVTTAQSSDAVTSTIDWLERQRSLISSRIIGGLIALMVLALVGAVFGYVWEKYKLRRRAHRIGLDTLPAPDQIKLAKQLVFYDEMVQLLARHQIHRPAYLTPLEFSDSLTFLPTQAYDAIQRLTDVFYRIRYGRADLTPAQRRHLVNVIAELESVLGRHHY